MFQSRAHREEGGPFPAAAALVHPWEACEGSAVCPAITVLWNRKQSSEEAGVSPQAVQAKQVGTKCLSITQYKLAAEERKGCKIKHAEAGHSENEGTAPL